MKKVFYVFVAALALTVLLMPLVTNALGGATAQYRNVYSSTNVTTSTWVQLGVLPDIVRQVQVFDSSGQTMELGVGAAGSQVIQFLIIPGGNGILYLNAAMGSVIWVKAVSGTASTGEIDLNFFN